MTSSEASFAQLLENPQAALRLLDAADAKDSLADFCRFIDIPGAPVEKQDEETDQAPAVKRQLAAHHAKLVALLQRVESGEVTRAMIFMPPGAAKSTYASVVFPVWFMGRKKRRNVIVATYASDLARKIGRRARSILRQPAYEEVFGCGLSPESSAADEWALTNENEFMGGGILSGITGNRADLLIIDDPIKGRQQADSETIRKTTREAYQDDLKTRLKPGGRIVLIQTRWHQDDLAGSILPENYDGESGPILCRDKQVWEVLCVPAQAVSLDDPLGRPVGSYLWPEWFPESHWQPFKGVARTWASLYQQRPSPDDGTFFLKGWFKRHKAGDVPKARHVYMTSDHAPAGQEDSDFQALRVWAVDHNRNVWLVDGYRGQVTMDKLAVEAVRLIKTWKPLCWFPEDDNNWKAAAPFIRIYLRDNKAPCRIEPISPHGADKPTKAGAFQAMASMGAVSLPDTPEGDLILDQYVKFPAGKHDDEVDAASLIGRAIDQAHPAILKTPPAKPDEPADRYARARQTAGGGDDFYG